MTSPTQAIDVYAISPFIALGATAVLLLLAGAFVRRHAVSLAVGLAGAGTTLALVIALAASAPRRGGALLSSDDYALFYVGLLAVLLGLVFLLSYGYLARSEARRGDYYVLATLATLGGAVLAASTHFATLFLGLEILSVSLYGLIAYPSRRAQAVEAGIKYLVLAASTAAFLLLGLALLYTATGSLYLADVGRLGDALAGSDRVLYLGGLVLVLTGLGFKLAVVPFHLWTPDVYQGAPAPVTGIVATISKGAVLALLLRYAAPLALDTGGTFFLLLSIVAYASMAVGNLLALLQQNLKRLLAYSSISHFGYMLVGLLAGGLVGVRAVTFYFSAYALAILAAFGVIAVLSGGDAEPEEPASVRGLGRRRPGLGLVLTIALLSLAGLPVSGGFIGKFFLIQAGASASQWGLLVVLALTSALGLFYYLRVIVLLYARERRGTVAAAAAPEAGGRPSWLGQGCLGLLAVLMLLLGFAPSPLLRLIERVAELLS